MCLQTNNWLDCDGKYDMVFCELAINNYARSSVDQDY